MRERKEERERKRDARERNDHVRSFVCSLLGGGGPPVSIGYEWCHAGGLGVCEIWGVDSPPAACAADVDDDSASSDIGSIHIYNFGKEYMKEKRKKKEAGGGLNECCTTWVLYV